ncbi:MAG: flagellar basal body P-ring formation chaperone FlgA [candidate division Zixibacteria bacterium]
MKLFLLPLVLFGLIDADVEKVITNHLNIHYPIENAEYVCDFSRLRFKDTNKFDSVAVDGYGKDIPAGNTVVRLSFFKDGSREHTSAGTIKIGILKEVLTSKAPIKAGEIISEDMVATQIRDIAQIKELVFDSVDMLGEVVATRYIPPGRIITGSSVAEPPVVVPGDMVEIRYKKGPLLLKAKGVVKQAGPLNAEIRVMNFDTNKIVHARVADSTTVVVTSREDM